MTFKTLSQLRQLSWSTKDEAVAELKRSGLKPRGADYELAEALPGSWQLVELGEGDSLFSQEPEPVRVPKQKAKAKKPAPVPKASVPKASVPQASVPKTKAEHPSDAKARARIDKAESYTVHFRVGAKEAVDRPAATLVEAVQIAEELNAKHGKSGRRAMIYALTDAGNGRGQVAEPIKASDIPALLEAAKMAGILPSDHGDEAEPGPEEPMANDLSPLGLDPSLYPVSYRVLHVPDTEAASRAQTIAHKLQLHVGIFDRNGKLVRTIDYRLGGAKPPKAARVPSGTRAPKGEGKAARAIALLSRPEGATSAELADVTGWPIAQRHINRLSKQSGKGIVDMGGKKWRLTD